MTSPAEGVAPLELDPATLYHEDGSVDFDAVEAYVGLSDVSLESKPAPTPEAGTLDAIATSSLSFSVDTSERRELSNWPTKEEDPLRYALTTYITYLLARGMEVDWPVGGANESLLTDPTHEPVLKDELERYFTEMQRYQPVRFENLQARREALGEPINDAADLKCIVAIPAAGHQEYQNIYHTLAQFNKQTIGNDAFEIVLYLNVPSGERERDSELYTDVMRTINEIDRFKADYPQIPVRYFTTAYRGEQPVIGKIRSDLWDTLAYDLQQRGREDDILVVSADADIVHANPQYLEGMYDTWKETGADAVAANLVWQCAPGLPYDATVNRLLRYQAFIDILRDNYDTFTHTADANTAISLKMYYAVGGYNREDDIGEMFNLIFRIRHCRNQTDSFEDYQPVKQVVAKARQSYLKSHSRRLIKAMALGRGPYDAWDQRLIKFGNDDELRTAEMEVHQAEEQAQLHWKEWVKRTTAPYIREVPLAKKRRVLKQARRILGFSDLYR